MIKRFRVEPFSTLLEKRRKGPIYPATSSHGFVYVSGLPPFDSDTGEVSQGSIEVQAEIVINQMKRCLETAGSSMSQVLKCNIYCTDSSHFSVINEVYAKHFAVDAPARTFLTILPWPGGFSIEIDCVAAIEETPL
jgi:2-iminobutanoate/2-iminopropanoate deaminase